MRRRGDSGRRALQSPRPRPAFFTKLMYFAGGGHPHHPCAILDENVALALQKTCGWTSLPLKGWLASAYQRPLW